MESFEQQVLAFLGIFKDQPLVQASIIAVSAFLAAYVLTAILKLIGLKIARRTQFTVDNEIVSIVRPPVFYSILMVGLTIALSTTPFSDTFKSIVVSLLKTANIIIWMIFLIRLSKIILRASARNQNNIKLVHPQSLPLFENLAIIIVAGLAIYLGFQTWGINMTAWLASAGVVGIAVGFASKDTLSNFIAGIFILADAPYKIGDYVVLDTGERGEITEIGIRSTRMLTRDDVELTIPNSIMGNTKIVNQSGGPYAKFRIRIPVGAAYGADVEQVKAILLEVATQNENVCAEPEARVRFRQFGPSSLDFELLCWVEHPSQRGGVTDQLLSAIYNEFKKAHLEIPFSKQDVYIKEFPRTT